MTLSSSFSVTVLSCSSSSFSSYSYSSSSNFTYFVTSLSTSFALSLGLFLESNYVCLWRNYNGSSLSTCKAKMLILRSNASSLAVKNSLLVFRVKKFFSYLTAFLYFSSSSSYSTVVSFSASLSSFYLLDEGYPSRLILLLFDLRVGRCFYQATSFLRSISSICYLWTWS